MVVEIDTRGHIVSSLSGALCENAKCTCVQRLACYSLPLFYDLQIYNNLINHARIWRPAAALSQRAYMRWTTPNTFARCARSSLPPSTRFGCAWWRKRERHTHSMRRWHSSQRYRSMRCVVNVVRAFASTKLMASMCFTLRVASNGSFVALKNCAAGIFEGKLIF